MYCLFCGVSLSEGAPFCSKCGKLTSKGIGESREVKRDAPTVAFISSPSDPYSPRPSTSYGPPPPEGCMQSPYEFPSPYVPLTSPPPQHRRLSPGFLKGFFSGIFVILLLSGSLGGWLLFKQGALPPSIPHSIRPTATPQPTNTTFQSLPDTWTQCAVETATCSFSGTMTVAFGANGAFNYATASNDTACTSAIFGDPLYGTQKACYIEATPPTTNIWTLCAAEDATCSFLGTMTVAFGANGAYNYATKTNGSACTAGIFGDPLYLTVKSCYLISPPTIGATWNTCAAENSTCSFTGKREVAYGANGEYFYGSFTNGTACTDSIFGNPTSGVGKTCYYQ
jgi:hypothetical protein